MKRLIAATVALAALTGPVFAQASNEDDPIIMDQKQKKKDAEAIDKQYKSTLDKTRQETTAPGPIHGQTCAAPMIPKPNASA